MFVCLLNKNIVCCDSVSSFSNEDFGDLCAGVTCDGDVDWRVGPQRCTARRGRGTLRQSPTEEVSYLKDVSYSSLVEVVILFDMLNASS